MEIVFVIVLAGCLSVEILLLLFKLRAKAKKRNQIQKSLYKMIEERVLEQSLKYRITSAQAAMQECSRCFLYMTFENTKPEISYLFALDEWITIGRNKENKVCIHDEMFSRLHCKIGVLNEYLVLQDQGSANGTTIRRGFFKKIDVQNGKSEVLQSGDVIVIGDYRIKIEMIYGAEAIG